MRDFSPEVLDKLERFSKALDKLGRDISANKYDVAKLDGKPNRRHLERITGMPWNELKEYVNKIDPKEREQGDKVRFLHFLKSRGAVRIDDFCDLFGCSKTKIFDLVEYHRALGMEISTNQDYIFLSKEGVAEVGQMQQLSEKEIVIGAIADLHFGSIACQITALKEFVLVCLNNGVKHILVSGDIFAGLKVYPGQMYDLYGLSSTEQIESGIINIPRDNDLEWIMMGGNHDYDLIKSSGTNMLKVLSKYRDDIKYVGFDMVTIPILNNVDAIMWHPSGGIPYSHSYRLQKGVEQVTLDELQKTVRGVQDKPKVRFLFAGHLHIQMQALFGSILGAQCGCFEGQTNYLKRKGLVPAIGGWIIKATLGKSGLLRNFEAKFYVFEEIENDYKNYTHSLPVADKIENPIFEVKK